MAAFVRFNTRFAIVAEPPAKVAKPAKAHASEAELSQLSQVSRHVVPETEKPSPPIPLAEPAARYAAGIEDAGEAAACAAEALGDFGHPAPETDHRAALAGYLAAGLQRPPSWSTATQPPPGAWCSRCGGASRRSGRWWIEASEPRGWRCTTCHPSPPGLAVVEVRT